MNQPKAIIPIFFTEMWERFGYYAIQGMLVLFLIYQLHYSTENAFILLSEFLSWVYIAPVFGGFIADRILGYRYSILSGAMLLCIGYLLLALEGGLFLHLSLAIIVVGNGLLKPNNPSYLGKFYYHNDPRRYPGFTFYFIGTNIGGLVSILVTSLASQYIGYHTAFGLVSVGMVIATGVFIYGFRYFENRGLPIDRQQLSSIGLRVLSHRAILLMLMLIVIQTIHFLLHAISISELLMIIVAFGVIISLFYIQSTYNQTTRNHLIAIIILITTSVIFWSLQLQIFLSVPLFINEHIQRTFFGFTIPAPLFVVLEPAFILMLGLPIAKMWQRLSTKNREPAPPMKFALGLLFVALAMTLLSLVTHLTPIDHTISPLWLLLFYILLTLGGLFISPTGMAMITELAPPKLTAFIMGVWYMMIGLGGLLAGKLARIILEVPKHIFRPQALGQYAQAFGFYALLAFLIGIMLLIAAPKITKLIHSQHT